MKKKDRNFSVYFDISESAYSWTWALILESQLFNLLELLELVITVVAKTRTDHRGIRSLI